MEQMNYGSLLPGRPLADAAALAREAGRFDRSYLIYREDRKERAVRVVCSACGGSFPAEKACGGGCSCAYQPAPFGWLNTAEGRPVISGQETVCPLCGKPGQTVHTGRINNHMGELVDDAWVRELLRLPAEGRRDRLAAVEWCVRRCVGRDGQSRYEVWPYDAWVVEEAKLVHLTAWRKTMSSAISLLGRWEQRRRFRAGGRPDAVQAPWEAAMLAGTTAENCRLDLYLAAGGRYPAGYLALWRKHPAAENLLVQGCGGLVETWLREEMNACAYRGGIPKLPCVSWKEKRPSRMLGLDREEFGHLRREGWSTEDLARFRLVRGKGLGVKLPEDMALLRRYPEYTIHKLLEEQEKADFWRILRYLRRQGREGEWEILRDYWRMARQQGRDLTDSLVRWPRDLRLAHDRAADEEKHREEEALREKFRRRAEALEPFSFAQGGLLIRPCRDQRELIEEGKSLHHCVAGYAKSHAGGKTAIFFIRRADRPGEPYFTLELDEAHLAILQDRGLRNCDPPEEVRDFAARWLDWVRKGAKRIA